MHVGLYQFLLVKGNGQKGQKQYMRTIVWSGKAHATLHMAILLYSFDPKGRRKKRTKYYMRINLYSDKVTAT